MRKDAVRVAAEARTLGYTDTGYEQGHLRMTHPSGATILISLSPSDINGPNTVRKLMYEQLGLRLPVAKRNAAQIKAAQERERQLRRAALQRAMERKAATERSEQERSRLIAAYNTERFYARLMQPGRG